MLAIGIESNIEGDAEEHNLFLLSYKISNHLGKKYIDRQKIAKCRRIIHIFGVIGVKRRGFHFLLVQRPTFSITDILD